jgi:hypothetical protein
MSAGPAQQATDSPVPVALSLAHDRNVEASFRERYL